MNLAYTFKGGIHIDEYKNTKASRTEAVYPDVVSIPMLQHIGAPARPLVKSGDEVLLGQKIGEAPDGLGCPVHSSVSGVVESVDTVNGDGSLVYEVVNIKNNKNEILSDEIKPYNKRLSDTTTDEIIEIVRNAGISGMGGAAFPTYEKIRSAHNKAHTLILNCAECEPFITANHRLILEHPTDIINGVKILAKAVGVKRVFIAIEDNKIDAANKLEDYLSESRFIQVKIMRTKYPQGDERQLIYSLTKKELPAGKLPTELGFVIFNAETAASVYRAFSSGMPLVKRIVTVDGDCIKNPRNLIVPIGTHFEDAVKFCGGLIKTPSKIISGGPMMGAAKWDKATPVTKGTSAILVFSDEFSPYQEERSCIRCGRCIKSCPMRLTPVYISQFSIKGDFDKAEKYGAMSCVECGCCSYICPADIKLTQHIRTAKSEIKERFIKKNVMKPEGEK